MLCDFWKTVVVEERCHKPASSNINLMPYTIKINIIDTLEGLAKFLYTYFRCFLFLSPHTISKMESQNKEQGHTLHQLLTTEHAVLFSSLWDLQGWFPVPTASLHLEQGTAIPLPSLTPSPELSPPRQALVLDAARQHHNTWVSDSWNAFSNPFLLPVLFYWPKFTNILRVSQSVHGFCNFPGLSQLCLLGWGWERAQMPQEPSPSPDHNSSQSKL